MAGEINDKVGEEHIKWRESEENGTTARNALANNRNFGCFFLRMVVFFFEDRLHHEYHTIPTNVSTSNKPASS